MWRCVRLLPFDSPEDRILFDAGFVSKDGFHGLGKHIIRKTMVLQTQFRKPCVGGVVVMIFGLDPRVFPKRGARIEACL